MMNIARISVLAIASMLVTTSLHGQQGGIDRSIVTADATGRVELAADHAQLTLGVVIQAPTPTLATQKMDARFRALTDTLVVLGFSEDSLPTARYYLAPSHDRRDAAEQIVGYTASAAVRLTIRDLPRIPSVIEAALAAGATEVSGLQFAATDERAALDEALRRALVQATRDARVLAEAAGGQLGDPIEISTSESARPLTAPAAYLGAERGLDLSAPLTPGAIIVEARVMGRWELVKR